MRPGSRGNAGLSGSLSVCAAALEAALDQAGGKEKK